ncbi:MAG: AI-2E family transporter [Lachnospiraceae bacterium]|nr:AI-2E family transporter [Lachnospiraceae bacterium]
MKWKPDKNQIRWGVTIFLTAAAIMLLYYLLFQGSRFTGGISRFLGVMAPLLYGIVIAYILSPVLHFVEKRIFAPIYRKRGIDLRTPEAEKYRKRVRGWSVTITMTFFLLALGLLLMIILPQLISNLRDFIYMTPVYFGNVANAAVDLIKKLPLQDSETFFRNTDIVELIKSIAQSAASLIERIQPHIQTLLHIFSVSITSTFNVIFSFAVGLVVAVYLLLSKEKLKSQWKKIMYAVFKEETANELISGVRYTHYVFSGFLGGKIIDSIVVAILCYIGALVMGTPYAIIMAVIVGVTNMIPFFGPYIGEFITFVLLVMIHPFSAVTFFLFLFVLQQIDGNIIGPKILGDSTGLPGFWVIVSVLLFGYFFGVYGWVLGVPLFAVLYAFIRRVVNRRLEKRDLPTDTGQYRDAAYVEKGKLVQKADADLDRYHVRHPMSFWRRFFRMRDEIGNHIGDTLHKKDDTDTKPEDPGEKSDGT